MNQAVSILVVDDEADILEFTAYNLSKLGYTVMTASNGRQAIEKSKNQYFDLYLLDVKMPDLNGIETAEEILLFGQNKQPILVFLSASAEEFTQLAAYNIGADEYITKPIKPQLLGFKIQALLRRKSLNHSDSTLLSVGPLQINTKQYSVVFQNKGMVLPRKEFELLLLLVQNQNQVVKRSEILDAVWGNKIVVGDRTIDVHIRKLRERFGNDIIVTLKGVGYQFKP